MFLHKKSEFVYPRRAFQAPEAHLLEKQVTAIVISETSMRKGALSFRTFATSSLISTAYPLVSLKKMSSLWIWRYWP